MVGMSLRFAFMDQTVAEGSLGTVTPATLPGQSSCDIQ